jgi:membrane fusion protein (multidrug efflux system)
MKSERAIVLAGMAVLGFACGCGKRGGGGPPPSAAVPVRVATVAAVAIEERLGAVATILADQSVEVRSEAEGTIARIAFEEGQAVTNGQLLAEIDATKAEAQLALAEANGRRGETLFAEKIVSRQEYDQLSAARDAARAQADLLRRQLRDARLVAPFAGTVGARDVSPGQLVSRATRLTTLVDADPARADFRVPERYAARLAPGQEVSFTTPAWPDAAFTGAVYFVAPEVDPDTRTLLVRARVPNTDGRLRPGMFVDLSLVIERRPAALVVPEEAVWHRDDRTFAWVVDDGNLARVRPVTLGVRRPGEVEVTRGLAAGERVIVEGLQKVRPDAPVTALPAEAPAATAGEPGA